MSSVVNNPPAPISAPTSAHSASSAISALNPLPAFSFLTLNSKLSALNCPPRNPNHSRTGHPTLDVHPELAEGIFSDSSYPLPQSTESSRKYPNHSSKSNYSRTYKTPGEGDIPVPWSDHGYWTSRAHNMSHRLIFEMLRRVYNAHMSKRVIRMSESEAATTNVATLLAHVRAGAEVVIENGSRPLAVLRLPEPVRRTISECIALLPTASTATVDADFAKDVAAAVESHNEPLNPPSWD